MQMQRENAKQYIILREFYLQQMRIFVTQNRMDLTIFGYATSQNHTKIYRKCIRRRVRAVLTQQIFSSPKAFLAGHIGNMSKRKDAGIGEICTSKPTWFDSRSAIRKSNIQTKRGTSFGAEQSFLHKMKQPLVFYSKISFSAPYSASRSA